jgi:hypothetical protein
VSQVGLATALAVYGFVLYAHMRVLMCLRW